MPTIKDIAASAGVCPSTVSKALRGSTDIQPETISRIRLIAEQMGYDLSRLNSKVTNSKTVGVVFVELNSEYYSNIFNNFKQFMESAGYRVITMITDFRSVEKQQDAIEYLLSCRVSGILYLTEAAFNIEKLRERISSCGTGFVMITRMSCIDFCDIISVNHALGARMAVEHLYGLGHRRIAFIGEPNTHAREDAFRDTIKELGITPDEDYIIVRNERNCTGGYEAAKELLRKTAGKRPTAIFAAYDQLAYGVMRAVREAGLRIPEDISIIGVDNNQVSDYITPALTSIETTADEVGKVAGEMLLSRIQGDTSPYQMVYLSPKLCLRDSCLPTNTAEEDAQ